MSEAPARSSTESSSAASASSGLDFDDTALTLRIPSTCDPDRKRAASPSTTPAGGSPRASASEAPPTPKAQVVGWPPVSRNRRNALQGKARGCAWSRRRCSDRRRQRRWAHWARMGSVGY